MLPSLSQARSGIRNPDCRGFFIGVDLRVKLLFNCGNIIGVFHDYIHLSILVLATILVSIPLAVHDDSVIRGNTICRSSPRFENTDDADFRAGSGGERTNLNSASDLQVKFFSDGSPDEGIVNPSILLLPYVWLRVRNFAISSGSIPYISALPDTDDSASSPIVE